MSNVYWVEADVSKEELEEFVTEKDPNGKVLGKEEIADQIAELVDKIGVDLSSLASDSDEEEDNTDDDAA